MSHDGALEEAIKAYEKSTGAEPHQTRGWIEAALMDAITAYVTAKGAILCDADPEVWTCPSVIDSGFGYVNLNQNDMIWDFAAQNWDNATVPLYTPLEAEAL